MTRKSTTSKSTAEWLSTMDWAFMSIFLLVSVSSFLLLA